VNAPAYTVRLTDWTQDGAALREVRSAVFVIEQAIPESLEWDAADAVSVHVLAVAADGTFVGCGRLLPDGHIGRMAVLRAWRGRGVGAALLATLVDLARMRGHTAALLHAQTHALDFYAKQGFVPTGKVFVEAGLPHQTMRLVL
jgi:predicted GNAT family N-acyltransferase